MERFIIEILEKIDFVIEELKGILLGLFFCLIIVALYFLIGTLIAIPYLFISGGGMENLFITAFFAPIALFLIIVFWPRKEFKKYLLLEDHPFFNIFTYIFFSIVFYFSIPILFNIASIFFLKMEYQNLSKVIFSLRYESLILLPVAVIIIMVLIFFVNNLWQKITSSFQKNR